MTKKKEIVIDAESVDITETVTPPPTESEATIKPTEEKKQPAFLSWGK